MSGLELTLLLGGGALAAVAGLWTARRGRLPTWVRLVLMALLLSGEALELLWPALDGTWSAASSLPLQLSDVAAVLLFIALWRGRPGRWAELAYLLSIWSGALGLAFPAVGAPPSSPLFLAFYLQHIPLVLGAVGLAAGLGVRLDRRSVLIGWSAIAALAAVDAAANQLTGGDYMFLRQPPASWSPLQIMGGWPWYVLVAAAICPLLLWAAAAPIWAGRRPPARPQGRVAPG